MLLIAAVVAVVVVVVAVATTLVVAACTDDVSIHKPLLICVVVSFIVDPLGFVLDFVASTNSMPLFRLSTLALFGF